MPVEKKVIKYWLLFCSFGDYSSTQFIWNEEMSKSSSNYSEIWCIPIQSSPFGQGQSSSHWFVVIFFPSSCLSLGKAWPWIQSGDVYHHLVWWVRCFEYLGSENTCPQDLVICMFSTSTFMSSPEAWNLSRLTISLGVQARFRVQWFLTKFRMCYLCLCSTLASMFPKFN